MPTEPPSDLAAEKRLVGITLVQPDAITALMGRVTPAHFFYGPWGAAYAAACDLAIANEPISPATIARRVPAHALEGVDGTNGLASAMVGSLAEEAEFWSERVLDLHKKRSLLAAGEEAIRLAHGDKPADTAFNHIEGLLSAARSDDDVALHSMSSGVDLVLERMNKYILDPDSLTGIPIGWRLLDRCLDGLRKGAVYIVYARTSSFKSLLVQNIGYNVSSMGSRGMWFTTETPHVEVMERMIQLETGLNFRELRWNGELSAHMHQIAAGGDRVRDYPLAVNDMSALDLGFVRGAVQRQRRQHGLDYVVIDLVDHVWSSKHKDDGTRNESFIMQQMKDLAKREDLPLILTTHVNKPERALGFMSDPYLDLDSMKGSSSKSQDVDAAISVMPVRLDTKAGWTPLKRQERLTILNKMGYLMICVAVTKNRQGPQEDFIFIVDIAHGGVIYEATQDQIDEYRQAVDFLLVSI